MGGVSGLLFCFAASFFFALLCGYLTGKLYNKTRGQEMIAGLIAGFFANGVYQFIFLFAVGVIITVPATHPMIMPNGIGVRMTVDLVPVEEGGLKFALENMYKIPFVHALLVISIAILAILLFEYHANKKKGHGYKNHPVSLGFNVLMCVMAAGTAIHAITTKSRLMFVRTVPVVTGLLIIGLCIFTWLIMKTKLGQDFRSVGQNQHIAEVSGINVDRTRLIATMISTVLAAWGQLIFVQSLGTLSTYSAHTQIGMFSVAALLVGGASTSRANIKNAIFGTILFNAMFIMSPEIGQSLFGQAILGEYFRTFMVYGVIGVALGLHVWKTNKKNRIVVE